MDLRLSLSPDSNEPGTTSNPTRRTEADPAAAQPQASGLMKKLAIPLETIANLTYLALRRADDPDSVRQYMSLVQDQMAIISTISRQTFGGPG